MAHLKSATPPSLEERKLLDAARAGDATAVQRLLEKGVNPNAGDDRDVPWNVTPLMRASHEGHVGVVKLLLNAGAEVNLRDAGIPGMVSGVGTALQYAISRGHEKVAQLLLESGARVNIKAGSETPLGDAVDRGLISMVELLIRHGANPNKRGSMKRIPLHTAAAAGDNNLIALLINAGSDVNTQDETGDSPLICAAANRHAETVKQLLTAGANPNLPGGRGITALMEAVLAESEEAARALIAAGAEVNATDDEGRTALDFALRDRLTAVTSVLREANGRTGMEQSKLASSQMSSAARLELRRRVESPELAAAVEELRNATGVLPVRSDEIPGGFFFKIPEEDRRRLVLQFHDSFLKRGLYLFASNHHMGVYPTTDKYEVLMAFGTNGMNYNVSTEKITSELKAIEKDQPFLLLGVGPDFVSGEFTTPIKNARSLAKRLYQLCPDIVDQGAGTLAAAAAELKRSRQLFLWWD